MKPIASRRDDAEASAGRDGSCIATVAVIEESLMRGDIARGLASTYRILARQPGEHGCNRIADIQPLGYMAVRAKFLFDTTLDFGLAGADR
jgi:hypothetical protein